MVWSWQRLSSPGWVLRVFPFQLLHGKLNICLDLVFGGRAKTSKQKATLSWHVVCKG